MDTIKPLYTATATAVGGRNGHTKSSDGIVSFDLSVPKEMGGPGRPEPRRRSIFSPQVMPLVSVARLTSLPSSTNKTRPTLKSPVPSRSARATAAASVLP